MPANGTSAAAERILLSLGKQSAPVEEKIRVLNAELGKPNLSASDREEIHKELISLRALQDTRII
ncbi:hypothetical protein N7523_005535 [Penicillium sp. IBT 18751x]|nr:hypothetical protein N7523_005879 [Penicillium sp. IBT 18751x]KAJ6117784.1 hypothetical protein N7523_005535 [Penicillium sp. IBT 18751x]